MSQNLSRRKLLGLIGIAAAALAGCGSGSFLSSRPARGHSRKPAGPGSPPCIVRPEQMEGPYFVDERLNRSDIRSDPSDGTVKEGRLLQLGLRVYEIRAEIRGNDCRPLPGAMVDIWHCDARGIYSDVKDRSFFDTRGRKFLRGYQITDEAGVVRFLTIYPGWYPGRAVHVHFKIRTNPESREGYAFTSQIYFDDALTDRIHARPPYVAMRRGRVRNQEDVIFQEGGKELILPLTPLPEGYAGIFEIGLAVS
jgi:protocatechuate 3,4-dioxygenase beta subunit